MLVLVLQWSTDLKESVNVNINQVAQFGCSNSHRAPQSKWLRFTYDNYLDFSDSHVNIVIYEPGFGQATPISRSDHVQ